MASSGAKKFKLGPIILKRLLKNLGLEQTELAEELGVCRETTVGLLNRVSYIPGATIERQTATKEAVESFVRKNSRAMAWLKTEGLEIQNIWDADDRPGARQSKPKRNKLIVTPSKTDVTINWEVEMVKIEAKKVFKLFKDPFQDDIQGEADIYMSDEHRCIEAAILDAARHSGFLAVVGDVGSGKSTIRKKVVAQLRRDNNVLIITPREIDKSRLTSSMICDAVIRDISNEDPKNKLEDKTRQVIRLLTERADSSQKHCLFIEEAHDLTEKTLKYLKRFYELEELEDGFRRLLGIVLIGQLEMKKALDERSSFNAREVIRRCQIVDLGPLTSAEAVQEYLTFKFARAGIKIGQIFHQDAFAAIEARLTVQNGKKKTSHMYPLLINNYAAKALNLAAHCGYRQVTAEVVCEV